jgi:hypothetical protein
MATVKEWSNAYAHQAKADFMTYQALEGLRSENGGGPYSS